jgi:hypothetical protein
MRGGETEIKSFPAPFWYQSNFNSLRGMDYGGKVSSDKTFHESEFIAGREIDVRKGSETPQHV